MPATSFIFAVIVFFSTPSETRDDVSALSFSFIIAHSSEVVGFVFAAPALTISSYEARPPLAMPKPQSPRARPMAEVSQFSIIESLFMYESAVLS